MQVPTEHCASANSFIQKLPKTAKTNLLRPKSGSFGGDHAAGNGGPHHGQLRRRTPKVPVLPERTQVTVKPVSNWLLLQPPTHTSIIKETLAAFSSKKWPLTATQRHRNGHLPDAQDKNRCNCLGGSTKCNMMIRAGQNLKL